MVLSHVRIGVDIGEAYIVGVVLAPDHQLIAEIEVDVPQTDYEAALMIVADVVTDLEKSAGRGTASVGIGLPGSVLPKTGFLQNSNRSYLDNRPVRDDLTRLLRRLVRCASIGSCFAISEAFGGAALGAKSMFGAILDDRCSGGIIINRFLISGQRGISCEWAHNPLPWLESAEMGEDLPTCWCGKHSCAEMWISPNAISRDFFRRTGKTSTLEKILEESQTDADVQCVLRSHALSLARSLAAIVNILDPEVIVLGGRLSEMEHLYTEIPILMAPYILSQDRVVDVRRSMHGKLGRACGAARLWEVS